MNEGIEALQWTQGSSKELNDVVDISYHALHIQHNLTIPDDKENLIMASRHVKTIFEKVVVGREWREIWKIVRTSGKILATPLTIMSCVSNFVHLLGGNSSAEITSNQA